MNLTHIFPAIIVALNLGAGGCYLYYAQWAKAVYWVCAAILTVAVTVM